MMAKKIILVEDDPAMIDIYREFFSRTDYDVELATTAEEMTEELNQINNGRSPKPDLILLDLKLRGGGGFDVLTVAKRAERLKNIPVFVVTNYENPDTEKELHQKGISPEKYLIKANFTPAEILDMINGHLGERGRPQIRTA